MVRKGDRQTLSIGDFCGLKVLHCLPVIFVRLVCEHCEIEHVRYYGSDKLCLRIADPADHLD